MKNFDRPSEEYPHMPPHETYDMYSTPPDLTREGIHIHNGTDAYADPAIVRAQEGVQDSGTLITPDNPLRIEDTPVGSVTVIRQDTNVLPYSAADMVELLSSTHPKKLDTPAPTRNPRHPIGYVPDREDVLVRWVDDDRKRHIPADPESAVAHMQEFERQVERLHALGMRMLPRTVIVVERDEHFGGRPNIYTATQRLQNPGDLHTAFAGNAPSPDVMRACKIIDILHGYLVGTTPGDWLISDSLYHGGQYAADGTWLDFDPYLTREVRYREVYLSALYNWEQALDAQAS